ncbi:uncharacterized protein LOC121866680 isoform X1 [Homarus americanus]|uniref:uncharacterized protein LOC121866680 isoform X1 n=1 Tax=Homarus americanus TaxID=6706 RepID=UPI001C4773C5|nr:uncharacterized protein LOC121866680 isoform X1 [Homarus americanus]
MDDQLYNQILNFYSSADRKYPQHVYDLDPAKRVNVKCQFRQTAKPFRADNGSLFHGDKEILVKTRVPGILKACHDNPATGGHFGRGKTFRKISQRYYWKGMKKDVQEYVKACTKCFVRNPKVSKEAPSLNPGQWVAPGDVETVLCEENDDNDNQDANSDSTSFTTDHLVLTTVDGKPIKEEMVEWMDEEIDGSEAATDGDTVTLGRNSSAAATASTTQWSEKSPRRKTRKVHHKPLDSLPIQIKNVSGSQGRARGPASSQDHNKDQEHSSSDTGESTFRVRGAAGCHTPDTKPKVSMKHEYVMNEEEELFGRYIAAAIRKLTNKSKSLAKMKIQEVLFNLEELDRNAQEEQ